MIYTECDYQILKLSDKFYNKYSDPLYGEILKKNSRAYNCLLFQTHYDYFICVPYRSEVKHNYAFHFRRSKRSRKHKSALDYTKTVIIDSSEYIDDTLAIIDKDEYIETVTHIDRIKRECVEYVEDYVRHQNGEHILSQQEFNRRYGFSTLRYFHKELGI